MYDATFYDKIRDDSLRSARLIVPRVLNCIRPHSVVDIGCGTGSWLRAFGEHGIQDLFGVDSNHLPVEKLDIPASQFHIANLKNRFKLDREFDLALCLEVAEHLPEASAPFLIESLVGLAPLVLFSAAIPHQGGHGHLNEQWPQYWSELFNEHGYAACDCFRLELWDIDGVAFWYAQNLLLFARAEALEKYPALRVHIARSPVLALVHPENYIRHADPSCVSLRRILKGMPAALMAALRRRL